MKDQEAIRLFKLAEAARLTDVRIHSAMERNAWLKYGYDKAKKHINAYRTSRLRCERRHRAFFDYLHANSLDLTAV